VGTDLGENWPILIKKKKEFKYDKNLAEVSFIKDVSDTMKKIF
jgi:hypothetical protein